MKECLKDGLVSEGGDLPESETAAASTSSEPLVNIYGVSLPEVIDVLDGARTVDIDSCASDSHDHAHETIAWEFGVEGYFDGLYRCAHCGNRFAVVFRDPYDDTREGRYRVLPDIAKTMDELVFESNRLKAAGESDANGVSQAHMPTMDVEVSRKGSLISVSANIAGTVHELVFDTESGSFSLDGDSYVGDGAHPHLYVNGVHEHPLTHDVLSAVPQVVLKLLEMLPPLPEGLDVPLDRLCERGYAINLLVAANRFIGYPSSFYEEMALSGSARASTCGLDDTYPFGTGLPRDYSNVGVMYRQAGLPESEQLERALLGRPQVLIDILRKSKMPFASAIVLARFFQLPRIDFCMRMLCFYPKSAEGWRRLTEVKGEEVVFSYVEVQAMRPNTASNLCEVEKFLKASLLLDALCDQVTDEQLADVSIDSLCKDLEELADGLQ